MSKVTKNELNERLLMVETLLGLHRELPEQINNDQANNAIFRMQCALSSGKELAERKSQLKQLDQSVFNGAHEMWKSASVDADGAGFRFAERPELTDRFWSNTNCSRFDRLSQSGAYDTSNWQNSIIERDIAKELLEVDLSSDLAGSELCKAMLARGDKYVVCFMSYSNDATAEFHENARIVVAHDDKGFYVHDEYYKYAVPINNQGEPLTASEVGL